MLSIKAPQRELLPRRLSFWGMFSGVLVSGNAYSSKNKRGTFNNKSGSFSKRAASSKPPCSGSTLSFVGAYLVVQGNFSSDSSFKVTQFDPLNIMAGTCGFPRLKSPLQHASCQRVSPKKAGEEKHLMSWVSTTSARTAWLQANVLS